jgi:hypothetical protein
MRTKHMVAALCVTTATVVFAVSQTHGHSARTSSTDSIDAVRAADEAFRRSHDSGDREAFRRYRPGTLVTH